jgi:formylmethanofuran dehydrogenase subunit E
VNLACDRCGKKLSRKTARVIDGKPLCSACLFPVRDGKMS